MKIHHSLYIVLALVITLPTACNTEYLDPASASETQVVNSVDGLIGLCNGMQYRWSVGRQSPVYNTIAGSGFTAQEFRLINAGNTDEANLNVGKNSVDGNNAVVRQLWTQSLLTIKEADLVLNNLSKATEPATQLGLKAYASIFKSLALGTLATYFEQAVVSIGEDQPFINRTEALQQAVSLLQGLSTDLNGAVAISADFTRKTPNSIDIKNTTYALLARYNIMLGNLDAALAAANSADLAVKSFFKYDATNPNPIFNTSNNVLQPRNATLGLPSTLTPDPNDARLNFYLATVTTGNTTEIRFKSFFATADASIPVYLPGEMTLIKAEVFARKNLLPDAIVELNKILTKTPAQDAWGVGANLPAYSGEVTQSAILTEIYKQRSIELFMSGLRLEDSRRFERPGPTEATAERNRNYYPYPLTERDNNPNTPTDPSI
jgi:starch-binding outer membrane protein, SusD/RagB family